MTDMERILAEQRRCRDYLAEHPGDEGATAGLRDWMDEEAELILYERREAE